MYYEKRGLSNVITTVLLILLAIAAVAIIWLIISSFLVSQGEDIFEGCFKLNFDVRDVKKIDDLDPNTSGLQSGLELVLYRGAGEATLANLAILINGRPPQGGVGLTDKPFPEELETVSYHLPYPSGLDKNSIINNIEISAIILSPQDEQVNCGVVADAQGVSPLSQTNPRTPRRGGPPSGGGTPPGDDPLVCRCINGVISSSACPGLVCTTPTPTPTPTACASIDANTGVTATFYLANPSSGRVLGLLYVGVTNTGTGTISKVDVFYSDSGTTFSEIRSIPPSSTTELFQIEAYSDPAPGSSPYVLFTPYVLTSPGVYQACSTVTLGVVSSTAGTPPLPSTCFNVDRDNYDTCTIAEGGDIWNNIDCNDNDGSINPGVTESCSTNYDDDCDADINEGCVTGVATLVSIMNGAGSASNKFISPLDQNVEFKKIILELSHTGLTVDKTFSSIGTTGGVSSPIITDMTQTQPLIPNPDGPNGGYMYELTLSSGVPLQEKTTISLVVNKPSGQLPPASTLTVIYVSHLPDDVDQSGEVKIGDVTAFSIEWNGLRRPELIDIDGDGSVVLADVTAFSQNWFGAGGRNSWAGQTLNTPL